MDGRGAGRRHAGLHPGGDRQARRAGPRPLQQGPFTLKSSVYLSRLCSPTPSSCSSGATAPPPSDSMITRKVTIAGFDSAATATASPQVEQGHRGDDAVHGVGKDKCLPRYSRAAGACTPALLKVILDFLGTPERCCPSTTRTSSGKPGGVSLSK